VLKVLYIRSCFDPGGTESLLLNLFNYKQEDIEFHYVLMKRSELIHQLNSNKNRYYCFIRKSFLDISVVNKIINIIHKEDINIIHSHQLIELIYALIIKIINPSIKIFHSIHGFSNKWWIVQAEKILIRFTKQSLTVSQSAMKILIDKKYPALKLKVLYNAVEIPTIASEMEKEWFYNLIHYSEGDFILGMIGNFRPEKDQTTLVKAFQKLSSDIPKVKLVLIGDTNYESYYSVKEFIETNQIQNIYFLGSVINANKYLYLFNLFILSSNSETFGLAVIEALMANVPVITSDIPVFKELSSEGKNFQLFQAGNYYSLYEEIKKIMINYNERRMEESSSQSDNQFWKHFGYKTYLENLTAIYNT
jgi:glycosyltransferase involved in cell wall biosynthesis